MAPFTREEEFVLRAGPLQLFPYRDSSNRRVRERLDTHTTE
jgi:hypothetical protein